MGLKVCLAHTILFTLSITGQFIWLVEAIINGKTLWEITYNLPCLTLCALGYVKVYYFIYYMHNVSELVDMLKKMQGNHGEYEEETEWESKKRVSFLSVTTTTLLMLDILGVIAFALGPIAISISQYYTTGEFKLYLPFLLWYPFDQFDIRFWPFVYIQQLWAAWIAVCSVYGPDCFFFTCCTFIQINFNKLQHDFERIVKADTHLRYDYTIATFKTEFVQLVEQHRELIRCVKLLESVYSKSSLYNVVTSSLIICASGFNLMAIDDYALMAPFTAFLIMGLLQIFYYCCYGDAVMRSSLGVSDAVYNSLWYETGAAERKYLLTVLVRSQKPCKLTAYGFTDINLRAYTRILSTSWSYFALLKQMYHN